MFWQQNAFIRSIQAAKQQEITFIIELSSALIQLILIIHIWQLNLNFFFFFESLR